MKILIITIFLYFSIFMLSFSQINISIDENCLKRNSALISKALIDTFGEDSIRFLLNNDIGIMFISQVDSLGNILKIEKVRSKWVINNDFVSSIEANLIKNKIRFYICYTQDPSNIQKNQIITSAREHFKNSNWKIINFGFPGELMNLYEYERKNARKESICLSKYDYLLRQINRFIQD
ncbi:MAG: hypothetical protein Q4G63_13125 [Bacteroidia bacterium]|nr:hypothetical protein [Bacteroidia bacterium]